jgi:hypothetical protein
MIHSIKALDVRAPAEAKVNGTIRARSVFESLLHESPALAALRLHEWCFVGTHDSGAYAMRLDTLQRAVLDNVTSHRTAVSSYWYVSSSAVRSLHGANVNT